MTSRLSPVFADGSLTVYHGVTSPPYWGLRDFGLPPSTWGGEFGCPHRWGRWAESPDQREADYLRQIKRHCAREAARREAA